MLNPPRPAPHSNAELWWAFFAILLITLLYLFVALAWQKIPPAADLFGHSLGVLGFLLMLSTETLYSLRKRSLSARWGRLSAWLRVHIFTGLVGPYMVLLHSSWKLNGLAGVTLLLTLVIVASGFIGRYIYTAIPRTADGVEMEAAALAGYLAQVEAELAHLSAPRPPYASPADPRQERELRRQQAALRKQHAALRRQVSALARTRRLLSIWHTIHVPLGLALFTAAIFHILAALYYATLPRLGG